MPGNPCNLASRLAWDTPVFSSLPHPFPHTPGPPPPAAATRYAAHAGILEAARATFIDLQQQGVLREALLAPEARYAGYRFVVAGHSLGAGCAFLLALYLRHFFPELRWEPLQHVVCGVFVCGVGWGAWLRVGR
jgi:hypothetical protein